MWTGCWRPDGFFERRCQDETGRRGGPRTPRTFVPIAEAETRARAIARWSNALESRLLRTGAYARAVIHSTDISTYRRRSK